LLDFTKGSDKLTQNEAKQFLDAIVMKEGRDFDEEILDNIFQNVQTDDMGKTTVEEFTESYIGATNFIQEEIHSS
jgi:Ca2+-binding EF-hand superfamily protein